MPYENLCAGSEAIHFCGTCPEDRVREFARTRSGGFIKRAYLSTLLAAPLVLATWQEGVANGAIIMLPETSGSYDPGEPKELKGYGDRKVSYGPREMKLLINDPDYYENYDFYNEISKRTDLVPFFRTSSLVHIFDTVAAIKAKDPVADDLEEEVTWEVECSVTSENIPRKFKSANIISIFTCQAVAQFVFEFGVADLDTTGEPLTEQEYLDAVEVVFTANEEQTANGITSGNVTVPSFGNVDDEVVFISVPNTEAAFTKWSVVGDSLQQDQPIDPDFATGSGVFFKSARTGELLYIVRSQTAFSGPVVLSR